MTEPGVPAGVLDGWIRCPGLLGWKPNGRRNVSILLGRPDGFEPGSDLTKRRVDRVEPSLAGFQLTVH
jgi:hypothetical protein